MCMQMAQFKGKYGIAKVEGMLPYRIDIIRGSFGMVICVGIIGTVVAYKKKKVKKAVAE